MPADVSQQLTMMIPARASKATADKVIVRRIRFAIDMSGPQSDPFNIT